MDNQRWLLHQNRIDVVEVELCAGRDHQGALRRTGGCLIPEVVEKLGAPVEEVAGGQDSAVKDGQSPDPYVGLEGVQTGPGTDRSPSGTVRRGARSLSGCGLGESGELSGTRLLVPGHGWLRATYREQCPSEPPPL